jgi:ABC-type bacteriocin/lantibiotic exporter with double-glycine peptidase domain
MNTASDAAVAIDVPGGTSGGTSPGASQRKHDPLLDCLVEACRVQGHAATRASLSSGLPLVEGRITLELAERAVARAGMAAKLQRIELAAIDAAALPAVLLLKDRDAAVLLGWDEQGQARLLLPETAARRRCARIARATGSGAACSRSASSTATCSSPPCW